MIMPMAEPPTTIREMNHDDVSMVSDIERRSYEFPWSHGVFRDCLLAGYKNIVLVRDKEIAGYGVLSVAAGEAHILNVCVDPEYRSRTKCCFAHEQPRSERSFLRFVHPMSWRSRCTGRRASTRLPTGLRTTRRTRAAKMRPCSPRNLS